jgi:ABC-type proline/glycine betaine transport system ATPase subunit
LSPHSELVVFFMFLVHLIENKFHQPDTMILLVLHINRNAVVVLLGCSTSGLVSDLDILFLFFKNTVGMLIVISDPHMQETDLTQVH